MSSRPLFRRPAVLMVLALGCVAAVVSFLGRITGSTDSVKKPVTLTNTGAAEAYPSFSPDGKRLAYSARASKNEPFHVFVRTLPNGGPRQLTSSEGSDVAPAWSPDGASVAFLRMGEDGAACMAMPASGGGERKIADCAAVGTEETEPAVSWTPDGQSLVVTAPGPNGMPLLAVVPAAGGAPQPLTTPPRGTQGDSTPSVSPDGKTVAFVRNAGEDNADIFTCELSGGAPQRLTFDGRGIRGLAWTPDGSHLVYAGHRMGTWRLWRLPATGGSARDLGFARDNAQFPAIAAAGSRLAYTDNPTFSAIWRAALGPAPGPSQGDAAHDNGAPFIRSAGREAAPSWSPDGRKIADISDQSGFDEIWISDAEGHNRTQLTHFAGSSDPGYPRWSPDGAWILFDLRGSDTSEVDVISAAGGTPKRALMNASAPSWSRDGKAIYYQTHGEVAKAAADGSNGRTLTTDGGSQPAESVDGKFVYYQRQGAIWREPADGGNEEAAIQADRGYIMGGAKLTSKGAYYLEFSRGVMRRRGRGGMEMTSFSGPAATLCFYDFATQKNSAVFEAEEMDFSGIAVSPDARYVLYSRADKTETNLVLVEGFK
jgi:Tol biopolymer transport system component